MVEYGLRMPLNVPYVYLKPSMTNFGQIFPITASSAQDWKDTSGLLYVAQYATKVQSRLKWPLGS